MNGGFNPNNPQNGFNPNQQYNDNPESNNNSSNNMPNNYGQHLTDRIGQVTDFINNMADGRRNRNQQQQENYYNDQPLNNVFADDPNEAIVKKAFAMGVISLVLSIVGIIVFWISVLATDTSVLGVFISTVFTIAGFVTGIIAIVNSSKYNKICRNVELVNSVNKKKNQKALVMAIIGVVFSGLSIVSCVACGGCAGCLACIGIANS